VFEVCVAVSYFWFDIKQLTDARNPVGSLIYYCIYLHCVNNTTKWNAGKIRIKGNIKRKRNRKTWKWPKVKQVIAEVRE